MAYLEKTHGLPAGRYSDELLAIDAESGPWLAESQKTSAVATGNYPRFELDLDEGVIWFGDEQTNGLVARAHVIGSYSPEDKAWVWGWTNERLGRYAVRARQAAEDHPEVNEFSLSLIEADEPKAWTLAAAVAYLMKGEACYRVPGALQLFVALTDLTEIDPSDPRAVRRSRDPDAAREALREFAGAAALRIGAALVDAVGDERQGLDGIIEVLHRFCERLDELSVSPVGRGTPAAEEATALAARLRRTALTLSLPPGHPDEPAAVQAALKTLEEVARQYDAWPTDSPGGTGDGG